MDVDLHAAAVCLYTAVDHREMKKWKHLDRQGVNMAVGKINIREVFVY